MYYSPHKLYRKRKVSVTNDSHGNPIFSGGGDEWDYIAMCRCDDNSDMEIKDDNGHTFRSKYKIVCDSRRIDIKDGDYIRVTENGLPRGEGRVVNINRTNYFNYTVIWV